MIRIFKFKKNDLNPSGGKQIEYSISDVEDFFNFKENQETIEFKYISWNPSDSLNGFRFKSTFKLSPARGDYKCYGNPDGSINLKSFFLEKLHLTEDNLKDCYGLKKISSNSYILSYFPRSIDFGSISSFFFGDNTDVEQEFPEQKDVSNISSLQKIYYGAPGTGKSYTIDKITTEENSVRTTFHPDSDYASFVGAYKPTMEDVDIHYVSDGEVKFAVAADNEKAKKGKHSGKEKKIVYKYVPQAFLKAYVKAWGDLENPYYLIIEEINRGNCAQIFGDLFQLLDRNNMGASSYPILADEDITRFLNEDKNGFAGLSEQQKNKISDFVLIKDSGERRDVGDDILKGKHLLLPPNLHIWATMNTSDQSLFPIDSAFKRRWDWEYMPIDYNPIDTNKKTSLNWKLKIGENLYDWGTFLSKINPGIETLTESSDKQMGYFFVKANPLTGIISEEIFKNKVLFYLWTEVLKDFDMGKDPFINPETKKTFKFTDFFDSNQNAVVNFITNLKMTPSNTENELYDEEMDELEGIEEIGSKKKLTVTFNDGSIIQENTYFDSYIKALQKIGLGRAEEIASEKKYKRFDEPLITRSPSSKIENNTSGFSYVKIGDFYIVKGTKVRTMINVLNLLSQKLNLNLSVNLE